MLRKALLGAFLGVLGLPLMSVLNPGVARAADHGDAPNVGNDAGADIADVFLFLDPNDNTRVIISVTIHGFIVPGEANNFGFFDPNLRYHFEIERTGDATPDASIDVTFGERATSTSAQTATVNILGLGGSKKKGLTFTAPTTPTTLAATANPQVVTDDPATGAKFFAGIVDDPFFFDIPATQAFIASVNAGSPNPAVFTRARDTFAGYNVMGIALSLPLSFVKGPGNILSVAFDSQRRTQSVGKDGFLRSKGTFKTIDRMGNPAVNVVLIPFARKSAYNASTPQQQARGAFVNDILTTLNPFGTDQTSIGILAGAAVTTGDYLHLDVTIPNTGNGGGDNAPAAFPNGRRLADDTVDILLTVINNRQTLGDGVPASDVLPGNTFPFFALPQQPRANGVADDNTRN